MPVQNGMGAPGLDFYCCIGGRFVAIETKRPGKTLTPRQEVTAAAIRDAGGLVFEIHDEAEVADMIKQLDWHSDHARYRIAGAPSAARTAD